MHSLFCLNFLLLKKQCVILGVTVSFFFIISGKYFGYKTKSCFLFRALYSHRLYWIYLDFWFVNVGNYPFVYLDEFVKYTSRYFLHLAPFRMTLTTSNIVCIACGLYCICCFLISYMLNEIYGCFKMWNIPANLQMYYIMWIPFAI